MGFLESFAMECFLSMISTSSLDFFISFFSIFPPLLPFIIIPFPIPLGAVDGDELSLSFESIPIPMPFPFPPRNEGSDVSADVGTGDAVVFTGDPEGSALVRNGAAVGDSVSSATGDSVSTATGVAVGDSVSTATGATVGSVVVTMGATEGGSEVTGDIVGVIVVMGTFVGIVVGIIDMVGATETKLTIYLL